MKSSPIASANCWVICARMSLSEKTAEKRSVGLSCAIAGSARAASMAAVRTVRRESEIVIAVVMASS